MNTNTKLSAQVDRLEGRTIDVLYQYLADAVPSEQVVAKARVAQATFGSIQKRRQTENARAALQWAMARTVHEGVELENTIRPLLAITNS